MEILVATTVQKSKKDWTSLESGWMKRNTAWCKNNFYYYYGLKDFLNLTYIFIYPKNVTVLAFLGLSFSGQWACAIVFFFFFLSLWSVMTGLIRLGSCIHQVNQSENNGGLVALIKDWSAWMNRKAFGWIQGGATGFSQKCFEWCDVMWVTRCVNGRTFFPTEKVLMFSG